ncbi:hypothetical protein [uncultured Adlercreutzia sp.]|uniref:hypothetical protein n=1 Tax=uncultured Adlercreutzia sp. TaxID=875803 RepID=UPI0025FD2D75|nr:hypothetical protein [uncultured Adlercreutzia sp.]
MNENENIAGGENPTTPEPAPQPVQPAPAAPAPQPEPVAQPQQPAQSANPFASMAQPQAAAPVEPAVAQPAAPAPQPSYAPYATGPQAAPAQAYQPQGAYAPEAAAAQAAQQAYYGSYGAAQQQPQQAAQPYGAQQPPVPPAAPPVQNVYPGYEPPQPGQKRRWPWFLLGLAVGLVIGMGGCASCVGFMALADYDDSYDSYDSSYNHSYDYDHNYNYDYDYDGEDYYSWPPEDNSDLGSSSVGTYTLEEIAAVFENEGIEAGTVGEGDSCPKGYYTVGKDGQIPAGLYYLEGSNEKLSHFYVFDGEGNGRYEVGDAVQYFGNYYAELDEGDLMVYMPGDDGVMHPASPTSTEPVAPYTNGLYRVGVDIPAGSYTITAATVGEGETDEDSAAFVMKDLDWDDDSIVDTQYVIPGGKQVVTVTDGQYLELFAATATPVSQG